MIGVYSTYFVNERKVHAKRISNVSCSLCSAGIWRDNHATSSSTMVRQDLVLDVLPQQVTAVEIVHRDVEKALILRVM